MKLLTLEKVMSTELATLAANLLQEEAPGIFAGNQVSFGRALDGESAEISVWEDQNAYLTNGKRKVYKVNVKISLTKLRDDEHE